MKRVIPVALVAFIAALSLALSAAQPEPAPTYLALKTTARKPSLDGTVVTLTLASGAWAKFRAIDIDYDRTAAYANTVVVKAETAITSADKKSLTLRFSRGFVATVWAADVDYDVMRSGFAVYHDRLGEAHPSKTATADDAALVAFGTLANARTSTGDSAEALARRGTETAVSEGQQGDKDQAKLHYDTALIALKQNDLTGAEQELQAALKFDSSNALICYKLAVVQKSGSPDDALSNLDRAEALGLPPTEKKAASELRPQIIYAVGRARRIYDGTWIAHDTLIDGGFRDTTWTFEVNGLSVTGQTRIHKYALAHQGMSFVCNSKPTLDNSFVASLSVTLTTRPKRVRESDNKCAGECCGDNAVGPDVYRITSHTDEELRAVNEASGEVRVFKKQ
jgi:hypothetical protein